MEGQTPVRASPTELMGSGGAMVPFTGSSMAFPGKLMGRNGAKLPIVPSTLVCPHDAAAGVMAWRALSSVMARKPKVKISGVVIVME